MTDSEIFGGESTSVGVLGQETITFSEDGVYVAQYTGYRLVAVVGGGGGAGSYSYSRYGGGGCGVIIKKVWLKKGDEVTIEIGQGGKGSSGANNASPGGMTVFGTHLFSLGGQGAMGYALTKGINGGGDAGIGNTFTLPTNLTLPQNYISKLSLFDLENHINFNYPDPTDRYKGGIGFGGATSYGTGGDSAYGKGADGNQGVIYILQGVTNV